MLFFLKEEDIGILVFQKIMTNSLLMVREEIHNYSKPKSSEYASETIGDITKWLRIVER